MLETLLWTKVSTGRYDESLVQLVKVYALGRCHERFETAHSRRLQERVKKALPFVLCGMPYGAVRLGKALSQCVNNGA